jgi:hypothetical protein
MQYIFEIFLKIFVSGRLGTGVTAKGIHHRGHRGIQETPLPLPVVPADHALDSILEVKHVKEVKHGKVDEQADS